MRFLRQIVMVTMRAIQNHSPEAAKAIDHVSSAMRNTISMTTAKAQGIIIMGLNVTEAAAHDNV